MTGGPTFALALEWSRPAGFAALALPLVVLLLQRTFGRPPEVATGTLAIWREVQAARTPREARARKGLPPQLLVLLMALVLGALALAGPTPTRRVPPRTWRVVVDRSPSMYLAWGGAGGGGESRLERALAQLQPLVDELVAEDDVLLWIDGAPGGDEVHAGPRPPAGWLAPPALERAAPERARHDRPGAILVTDRAPAEALAEGGFVASGGAAVPGLVGRAGEAGLLWDGEQLVAVLDAELPPARVTITGEVPADLRALLELWADERGLVLADDVPDATELALVGPGPGARVETRAGRDGWQLRASAHAAGVARDGSAPLDVWLGTRERALVGVAPGRIALAFDELTALEGDLEAFALSWSRLFDAARRAPAGCVAFDERADAGAPSERRPAEPAREGGGGARTPYDAWLALAAAALACVALAVPGLRRRARAAGTVAR